MASAHTDLAMECFDGDNREDMPGVRLFRRMDGSVATTEVCIESDEAGTRLGKTAGRYVTLECKAVRERDPEGREQLASMLANALSAMLPGGGAPLPGVLVVGLGNRAITPDALGPAVVDRTLVTRHLSQIDLPTPDLRTVSAIAPGVLGVTGIETMEMVESLARLTKPSAIICIDSLSARSASRIGAALQLTDTGIQPGAGVGNHRRALTRESIGAPVIAIGMPTVIYAATLARDAFGWLNARGGDQSPHEAALSDMEQALLGGDIGSMIVTPREIDTLVEDAAGVIASALNRALQPGLSDSEIKDMML